MSTDSLLRIGRGVRTTLIATAATTAAATATETATAIATVTVAARHQRRRRRSNTGQTRCPWRYGSWVLFMPEAKQTADFVRTTGQQLSARPLADCRKGYRMSWNHCVW